MTAMADALAKAGYSAGEDRLRLLAYELLRAHEGEPRKAISAFTGKVRSDLELMNLLFEYSETRDRAFSELERAAKDMRGERTEETGSAQAPADSHQERGAPVSSTEKTDGEDEHKTSVGRAKGLSSSSAAEIGGAEEAQTVYDSHARHSVSAPPSQTDGRGGAQKLDDSRQVLRPPLSSAPKRGPEALFRIHAIALKSKFDTIILRDGKTPIGDLVWSAIPRFVSENKREAALLKLIYENVPPPAYPNAPIREFVPPDQFERFVQKAAEISE